MLKIIRKIYLLCFTLALSGILTAATFETAKAGFEWAPAPPKAEPPPVITPPPASAPPAVEAVPVEAVKVAPPMQSIPPRAAAGTEANPTKMQTLEIEALESDPGQRITVKTLPPPKDMSGAAASAVTSPEGVPPVQVHERPQPRRSLAINPFPNAANLQNDVKAAPAPRPQRPQQQTSPKAYPEISGFGSDLPLALALRQVVPAEYSFSFGNGVNPGYRVSWNGGRPWNEVLDDMIAPLDLSAHIFEKSIKLTNNGGGDFSAKEAQSQEPQAGDELRRTNITDPGETPESKSFGGFKMSSNPDKKSGQSAEKEAVKENTATQASSNETTWEAKQGDSLKTTLDAWSKQAGVELVWNATHDHALNSNIVINGTFSSALEVLFASAVNPASGPSHELQEKSGTEGKTKLTVQDKPSAAHPY